MSSETPGDWRRELREAAREQSAIRKLTASMIALAAAVEEPVRPRPRRRAPWRQRLRAWWWRVGAAKPQTQRTEREERLAERVACLHAALNRAQDRLAAKDRRISHLWSQVEGYAEGEHRYCGLYLDERKARCGLERELAMERMRVRELERERARLEPGE